MKLDLVTIENYRAIDYLALPLDPSLTVLHGDNAHGKTSVLSAIAVGLGNILTLLPEVSGIRFLKTDRRGFLPPRVALWATNGIAWETRTNAPEAASNQPTLFSEKPQPQITNRRALKRAMDAIVSADREGAEPLTLPIVAFYDANRAVFDAPQRRSGFKTEFSRYAGLEGALSARTNFREFFEWFYAQENEELREQKARRDFDFRLKDLSAVRTALAGMVQGVSDPRIQTSPVRFVVSVESDGKTATLALDQLSGGVRIMLALAADLARRMAQGNSHLDNPLESEAIVLIDEVELHLHPAWQQRVLADLTRTFPNVQFIVSTHSPQVLTTVKPEQIVELRMELDGIVAEQALAPTYGAESGDVLAVVMGVDRRPDGNPFVALLRQYMALVSAGEGESETARNLRHKLESISPQDPDLNRADIEIRRRKVLERLGHPT